MQDLGERTLVWAAGRLRIVDQTRPPDNSIATDRRVVRLDRGKTLPGVPPAC